MRIIGLIVIFWSIASPAISQERDKLLGDCASASQCLDILDAEVPKQDAGVFDDDVVAIRKILKSRFGDNAKYALLDRAISGRGGWRNLAGALLMDWGGWTEADVPKLRDALRLNNGSWIARCLADIGSPQAIKALVEDFEVGGFHTQTGWALKSVGPSVLPYLLPLLETPSYGEIPPENDYREGWRSAAELIGEFRSRATVVADDWTAIAKNRRERPVRRIAALRGLNSMGSYIGDKAIALRPLLRDRNEKLAAAAFETLTSAHDPFVVRRLAQSCRPKAGKWDEFSFDSMLCLRTLSEFGTNANSAGDLVEAFLASPSKSEQLYAIETLGLIGRRDSIPKIEPFLFSKDWRQVYAAVRALGQLGAKGSVAKIEEAVREHWLSELERHGERVATALLRNQPYSHPYRNDNIWSPFIHFADYDTLLADSSCEWGVWEYQGEQLKFEGAQAEGDIVISLADGDLVGTDRGEFGGALVWKPKSGAPVTLIDDNTGFIFPVVDGFISIHGLAHLTFNKGFAAHIRRSPDGKFEAEEVARFTGWVSRAKRLQGDTFAAESDGRVVIFSPGGIMEAAHCDYSARPRD